jgi:hypothetical protein
MTKSAQTANLRLADVPVTTVRYDGSTTTS